MYSVQILSIALIPSFTVICKPNTQPVNQFADVMGFRALILPGQLISDGKMTFLGIRSLCGHTSVRSFVRSFCLTFLVFHRFLLIFSFRKRLLNE
jgi:hypothetical protein